MTLHIFNPEHDIALAINKSIFTAPHSARELRADLGFLPALYAEKGDWVLVENVEAANESLRHLNAFSKEVEFLSPAQLAEKDLSNIDLRIQPWGWDRAITTYLLGINPQLEQFLPSNEALDTIRNISNRSFAACSLLPHLVSLSDDLIGDSIYFTDSHEKVMQFFNHNPALYVIKAPWSCSGRGVRYIDNTVDESNKGWMKNILEQQGGLIIEPYYNRVLDFGMEFYASEQGEIEYKGLSIFSTENRAYSGNLLANEAIKKGIVNQFIKQELLQLVQTNICSQLASAFKGKYIGNFGVDMMVVTTDDATTFKLHPCVELNLRTTMGHVALALSPTDFAPKKMMKIDYLDKYHLAINLVGDDLLDTNLVR